MAQQQNIMVLQVPQQPAEEAYARYSIPTDTVIVLLFSIQTIDCARMDGFNEFGRGNLMMQNTIQADY